MICIQKIYGLHGLNHQIIEKSWYATHLTYQYPFFWASPYLPCVVVFVKIIPVTIIIPSGMPESEWGWSGGQGIPLLLHPMDQSLRILQRWTTCGILAKVCSNLQWWLLIKYLCLAKTTNDVHVSLAPNVSHSRMDVYEVASQTETLLLKHFSKHKWL